jgi:hypothetical protein
MSRSEQLAAEECIAKAVEAERERCSRVALEQRCERGTAWDLACTTIAAAILRPVGGAR